MSVSLATCGSLAAILASASPGDVVRLEGDCGQITMRNIAVAERVTVDARQATVGGLWLYNMRGLNWVGGVIYAKGGLNGFAREGYGVLVQDSQDMRFDGVTITRALRGMVANRTERLTVVWSDFRDLRSDGLNLAGARETVIENNRFFQFTPNKPTGSKSEGTWKDGDHPDAIQIWQHGHDILIRNNVVHGDTQGINTFGAAPGGKSNIRVVGNRLATLYNNSIALLECNDCLIRDNVVDELPGARFRARIWIRNGRVTACNNVVRGRPATTDNKKCDDDGKHDSGLRLMGARTPA